jgi:hypothetical protein
VERLGRPAAQPHPAVAEHRSPRIKITKLPSPRIEAKLRVVKGRADLERVYRELFNRYTELRIFDLRVDTLRDPDRLLARWHTHAELVGGGTYENHLIGLFEFDPPGQDPQLHGVLQPAACGVVAPAAAN